MGNINTKMGNIKTKKKFNQSEYRAISPCSDSESMSIVSSIASNPAVAKRLSQAEAPPRVPSRQLTTPTLVPESPSNSNSQQKNENFSTEKNLQIPEIPVKISRVRSDSCGGTVNSPLRHAHPCPGPRSPERRSFCCRGGIHPNSENFVKIPACRRENVPPPYRANAPRLQGHKVRNLSMAPQDEQHRWTWNLQPDNDKNIARISEKDINLVLRRMNAVVRSELSHSMADNDEYKLEVKLTKIQKPNQNKNDQFSRDHGESDKIYSVPLRKHLVAREMAAESPRPAPAGAGVGFNVGVGAFACPSNKSRQNKFNNHNHDDLVRILAQNHERNKITLLPAAHAKAASARRERTNRHWERPQKSRFEADMSTAPDSPVNVLYQQRMVKPKSTLI